MYLNYSGNSGLQFPEMVQIRIIRYNLDLYLCNMYKHGADGMKCFKKDTHITFIPLKLDENATCIQY